MIVLPMAGRSQRFRDAGFNQPKWQLLLGEKTVLEYVFLSFTANPDAESILVVAYEKPVELDKIVKVAEKAGVRSRLEIVNLDGPTRGQAQTVYRGLLNSSAGHFEPLTVFNVDTLRPGYLPTDRQLSSDGWLECVVKDGDAWSFVLPAEDTPGLVSRVTEKERISALCSTGMYFFASRSIFEWAYRQQVRNNPYPELYVAPLYNHLIMRGLKVSYDVIDSDWVHFCGTPGDFKSSLDQSDKISEKFAQTAL